MIHMEDILHLTGQSWKLDRLIIWCISGIQRAEKIILSYLREMEIYFGKKKAFMAHGHQYSVSLGVERILDEGRSRNADIVMFGHTHRPYLKKFGDITVLNPGSLAFPRQEGRKGSYIIMEMDRDGNTEFTIHYLD